jgi:hypothetical protein
VKNLAPTGIRLPDRPFRSESLYRLNKTACEKPLQETVHELKFPELTIEGLKLKIKIIHAAVLAKVIKSAKCGAGSHIICVPKLFWFN